MYDARFGGSGNRLVRYALTLLEKLSCRVADRVIATNESYLAVDVERGKVSPERITVVRNGPDSSTDDLVSVPALFAIGWIVGVEEFI